MTNILPLAEASHLNAEEIQDWFDSFDDVVARYGRSPAVHLLQAVAQHAVAGGVPRETLMRTPYVNSISTAQQSESPSDETIERPLRNYIRWNAMAMVVRANRDHPGIGGHISSVSSILTLVDPDTV